MKEMSPTAEQLRQVFVALSDDAAPQPDCPEPGRIWDAAHGKLDAAEAAGTIDHTSRCFVCAETWRLAHEMDTGGLLARKAAGRQTGFTSMMWLAAAAAVTLTVGVGLFVAPARKDSTPVMREGEETAIQSLVPESEALPRAACVLRWTAAETGARYNVQVGTGDLTPVAQAGNLDRPEFTVPFESLEKISSGAPLLWRVEAILPDGSRIASATFISRLQ